MEELIVVITVKLYANYEDDISEYATCFSIPNSVYLALLTGGESAIKSYYKSNGPYSEDETIISAKMNVARIEERGQKLQIKTTRGLIYTYTISSGKVVIDDQDSSWLADRLYKQTNNLVKISYKYSSYTKEAIFAAHDDGTYSEVDDLPTKR